MDELELETLERWIIRKTQRAKKQAQQGAGKNGRKTSLSRWKFCVHADKRQMLQELTQSLQRGPSRAHVLFELAGCISSAVSADGFRLFLAEQGEPDNLTEYVGEEEPTPLTGSSARRSSGVTVPGFVARTREPVRLSYTEPDPRFPNGLAYNGHVMCQAVLQPDGSLAGVLELRRGPHNAPFHEEDEEISQSYLVWGGIALHYAHLYLSQDRQRRLNDFLLTVVKSIFQDMVSMDLLVTKVMNFAQRLVDADRASLFLLDARSGELYARIFDVGGEQQQQGFEAGAGSEDSLASAYKLHTEEIRFPMGTGIAGQVARTGEVLNIPDAYSDPRFNRSVDQLTGYRTRSILCMPIFIRGALIGVVQMVNKRSGTFNKEDEEAFETFAVYCGLALHHAKLYDKIRRSEQKYRVALDVLSYHNTCLDEEVQDMLGRGVPDALPQVDQFHFNVFDIDDLEKARHAVFMFKDLFGLSRFDEDSLIRFTLTVRKNYRRVPYHNWTHGFSVANTMYAIIKHSGGVFREEEALALYIGSLCHDLDHRGKNNQFMLETESPLASVYSTSTMEHHHFNQTVAILQQQGHNIFQKLTNSEYKQVLGLLKHCILATDLAAFFPNRERLTRLVSSGAFSWDNDEHRLFLGAIAMTASDLSASAKPWELQVKTVKVIFEEFYQQGDEERAVGMVPIPMMDRNQPDQQAASQVGFLTGICLPCYSLLSALIPDTRPLLDECRTNLERWRELDNSRRGARGSQDSGEPPHGANGPPNGPPNGTPHKTPNGAPPTAPLTTAGPLQSTLSLDSDSPSAIASLSHGGSAPDSSDEATRSAPT
ncbi:probable 3',5'-cyclic phosphodiesterase pde-5 isoform X2 [Thrips palmi]|nr:probable 3',5'-cyclic phosphodiesterase pde-5 isoform X2 [Thrips palmi]